MLEQPARVRADGTIDDRYRWDDYDEMMYQADRVLLAPVEAGKAFEQAEEHYMLMEHRAQGIAGYDYAEMGKYGCRITGSGCGDHDPLTDFAEAGELVRESEKRFHEEQEKCRSILQECTTLTEEQRTALETRYCSGTRLTGYELIAALNRFTNYQQAYYLCKKGYEVFALWLHDQRTKEDYKRCMENPPAYKSTIYG